MKVLGPNSNPVRELCSVLVSRAADEVWLTMGIGLIGTAEPAWPYDEEGNVKMPEKEVTYEQAQYVPPPVAEDPSSQGLSIFTKLVLFAIIVGVCLLYIKAHSPRRTAQAGRHGAYEKGGLP